MYRYVPPDSGPRPPAHIYGVPVATAGAIDTVWDELFVQTFRVEVLLNSETRHRAPVPALDVLRETAERVVAGLLKRCPTKITVALLPEIGVASVFAMMRPLLKLKEGRLFRVVVSYTTVPPRVSALGVCALSVIVARLEPLRVNVEGSVESIQKII
jgi:hypothetical protein